MDVVVTQTARQHVVAAAAEQEVIAAAALQVVVAGNRFPAAPRPWPLHVGRDRTRCEELVFADRMSLLSPPRRMSAPPPPTRSVSAQAADQRVIIRFTAEVGAQGAAQGEVEIPCSQPPLGRRPRSGSSARRARCSPRRRCG